MWLEALSKMSRKIPSQDSSFEEVWELMESIEPLTPTAKAKRLDDWYFHEEPLNNPD
tara:strand:+ start:107 stop:277 length:171 start_codon:yes stop_codon:yes gene_type:complete